MKNAYYELKYIERERRFIIKRNYKNRILNNKQL